MPEDAAFAIAPADAEALAWMRAALAEAGLCPLSQDTEALAARVAGGGPVGAVALERYGADALLRSLVVAPGARGRGLGTALVYALERTAGAAGIATLYLLTETAEAFFAARGYEAIERADVPAAVAASEQFRLHCPASAVCMRRRL